MQKIIFILMAVMTFADANAEWKSEGQFTGWDQKRTELLALFLPPDPVIVQAGGHYGIETLVFAKYWSGCHIFAFEPNPHAYQILASKTAEFKNIQTFNLALAEQAGIAPFYVCHGSEGNNDLFEHASSLLKPSSEMEIHYQGPVVNVECVVLDSWCVENDVNHIDLLALNLQGSELQVLRSSPEILNKTRCIAVHTNLYPFRVETTEYDQLQHFLEQAGFQQIKHTFLEGVEGEAIFVNNKFFFNEVTDEYLKTHHLGSEYQRYFEPFFQTYYDLEENDDTIKQVLRRGEPYEGNVGLIIQDLTKRGSVAVDIGAHIGVHTVKMSRKAGPQGAVVAFEPSKKLYMELLNTLKINECTNVVSIARGLGNVPQTVLLDKIKIEQHPDENFMGESIDIMTLDSLNLQNVSLIKMDIENYEYFALQGAKQTIMNNRPVIIFECWIGEDYEKSSHAEKDNFDRVIALIKSLDYDIHVIYSNDFIAFPKEIYNKHKSRFKELDLNNFDLGL